jgi:predicted Ser/Thr protein kinase
MATNNNNNQRVKKRVDRYLYHTEDIIGKGQFGYVYKGEHCETGE